MTESVLAPVVRDVTVPVDADRAFQVFTEHFDAWWPRTHHIGAPAMRRAVIEPRTGGRWYEIGVDGSECDWGTVVTWDPPHELVLTWQIDGTWQPDPDPAHAAEVHVRFEAVDAGTTRVTVEHRHLERLVASDEAYGAIGGDGGWATLLAAYATVVGVGT